MNDQEIIDETRDEIRDILDSAKKFGPGAYEIAVALLSSDLSADQILEAAKRAPSVPSGAINYRGGAVVGDAAAFARAETPRAEAAWLTKARADAERAWRAAFPELAPPVDKRTPAEVAFGDQVSGIAAAACARVQNGQVRFRGDIIDEGLAQAGRRDAERLLK